MKELNIVLSLFDGMSCGQEALKKAGIKYNHYFASEIDKYAIQIAQKNNPNTHQLGDITKWREWELDWARVDLLIGGSPCQGFSFAGKQLNFNDERSRLFFEYVDILNHVKKHNPNVKFMLENVVMKKEYQNVISQCLQVGPVQINSALVSAQNRKRLYWANWIISQPQDIKIYLKDILQPEHEVENKYYLTAEQISKIDFSNIVKKFNNDIKIIGHREGYRRNTQVYAISGKTETLDTCTGGGRHPHIMLKIDKKGNIKNNQEKASCLTGGGHSGGNHSDMDLIIIGSARKNAGVSTLKSQTLLANSGKDITKTPLIIQAKRGFNKGGVFTEKSPTLSSCSWEYNNITMVQIGLELYVIRRLTPIECERLQTLPDNTTQGVSDSQRYKMIGNGWTRDVIEHNSKDNEPNNLFNL